MLSPASKPYQKLPGRGAAAFKVCRLWLGEDHLLHVQASSIGERYKRFYFADIQAFVVRKTIWGYVGWMVLWLVLIAWFAGAARMLAEGLAWWVLIGATVAAAGGFIAHLALGPTCTFTVRTAVQSEELPSLRRLRRAREVIARVRPLIEAAQAPRGETVATAS